MSAVEASVFRHPSSTVDQVVLNADGSFGGELNDVLGSKPSGQIATVTSSSTQALTTSLADVTSLSVSADYVQNRRYMISMTLFVAPPASSITLIDARVVVGSTNLNTVILGEISSTSNRARHLQHIYFYDFTASSASLTTKVQALYSGEVSSLVSSAGFLSHELKIYDMGAI
jgi:hypothetical protein